MTEEQIEKKRSAFKRMIGQIIQVIIREAMGFGVKDYVPIKKKVTFQELIDYKFKSENQKFEHFLTITDNIVENVRIIFPFINLEGIDLSWTTEELENKILEIFEKAPEMNLENCPRLSEQEKKTIKKKKSQTQKELEKRLEIFIRKICQMDSKTKIARRWTMNRLLSENFSKESIKPKAYFDSGRGNSNLDHHSQFERDVMTDFPELINFRGSGYMTFSDIMNNLKKAHKI